ncbi:hypothetical protein TTHERM_00558350 (macronuclear) [Tetrahymena thermophila SB210]|uniref:Uncharacterized protein n=2 Tax=Tetrahymena thermophila TaxID=5911 RepID=I7M9N1_TETTS|nr:hypothetical protein TTHERM_00558350 [Tetrahymena thermophila SB210]AAL79508.1 induced during granule regeneration 1 precursor [Tetrahymena thermophila]EAS02153.3 hypothetical protein TTHERM_00558350 [Tetrahymena thermophila SB210]|eukprot:XP_001022398.3 hypothetical protein TTHERM_00558350 [Tetrahymena thermophila SB210]
MRKIILLLAIISLALCQELIVEKVAGQYNSGQKFAKSWQNSQWNDYQDFAIYGWFKIDSSYQIAEWSTGFHFTSNQDKDWTNASAPGDRVLAFWVIGNTLHNPTYSLARGNTNYYENLSFAAGDTNKWAFIYVTHGSSQQAQYVYYLLPSSGVVTKKIASITHKTSTFYQINVGQSFSFKYFPGSFWRLSLIAGPNAYRESGFEQFQNIQPDVVPSCPILFTGCNYSGKGDSLCQSSPSYNVTAVHSIYLPANFTATLHDQANYAGKKIVYSQSIECITQLNWAYLLSTHAITIEDETKTVLRRNNRRN